MVRAAFRGVVALIAAVVVSSPALPRAGPIADCVFSLRPPSALMMTLIIVAGLLVGCLASRRRPDP